FVEEAIGQYRRIEALREEFERAATELEVTVRSPDGLVEIVVTGAGEFRDVVITDEAVDPDRASRNLARAVLAACQAASSAREWARHKLYEEHFRDYRPLSPHPSEELSR
ncbi:MAG TPA: YbaB/EbfC family nucleoid-associated protein, partial [Micromonosporaceae bacterium]